MIFPCKKTLLSWGRGRCLASPPRPSREAAREWGEGKTPATQEGHRGVQPSWPRGLLPPRRVRGAAEQSPARRTTLVVMAQRGPPMGDFLQTTVRYYLLQAGAVRIGAERIQVIGIVPREESLEGIIALTAAMGHFAEGAPWGFQGESKSCARTHAMLCQVGAAEALPYRGHAHGGLCWRHIWEL